VRPERIVIVTPTRREMAAFDACRGLAGTSMFVGGVGPGAIACGLATFLALHGPHVVVLAGLGGGYPGSDVTPGDVCLATSEAYGDLGRCTGEGGVEPIRLVGEDLPVIFPLEHLWRGFVAPAALNASGILPVRMVSVSCVTGTEERARFLQIRFDAGVENMEGAAAAYVCDRFAVPLLEFRGISNRVGDLDRARWDMDGVMARTARLVEAVLEPLIEGGI